MTRYVTAGTRVDKRAPTRRRAGTEVPWGLFSPLQIRGPVTQLRGLCTPPSLFGSQGGRRRGWAQAGQGWAEPPAPMPGCARPLIPHCLATGRRSPGFRNFVRPSRQLVSRGWWRLGIFAGDGRGCRYGDRSVARGAASLGRRTGSRAQTPPPALPQNSQQT